MQVYTWPDASLRELTDLVKEVKSEARRTTARFEFAFVYPDRRGRNVLRQVVSWADKDSDLNTFCHSAGCMERSLQPCNDLCNAVNVL